MIVIALLRGIFHYAEQYCNHFIAFKLLAIIRHKVFAALRKLCPAKLEGREKGNLISIITTDIELLEVFYAHTISPIAIAILTSLIMVIFMGKYHWAAGLLALAAYLMVGVVIPMWNGKRGSQKGMEFRTNFGELNSFVLDSLRGLDETIQYGQREKRKEQMEKRSENLSEMQKSLTCTIAMMGSFGSVVALSNLSNNLNQTLASGERVLSLLEEEPLVEEIPGDMESYVTQGTHLFHDSIANNIAIAKPGASREEIMEAAKKASIHDFIKTLPKGYDTEVGEFGDTLSGGEKQRIGIARAFLHDSNLILLREM